MNVTVELGGIWMEAVVVYFNVMFYYLLSAAE
jgi:hypothetical protein